MHIVFGRALMGHAVIGYIVIGLVFLVVMMLLTSGAAQAFVAAPTVGQANGLVLQARGAAAGGGGHHAMGARRNHRAVVQSTKPPGVGAAGRTRRNVVNRNLATDGNVTNGPNVTASRDINDRRAVLLNDGRVVVLKDQRAAVLNGMSGVLIRLHD
ncbi:MAG TPA: hypothetical protein VL966_17795 [Alphaproteobacteria bacterium]|nr:hypothetical protein [Alphaproteobacteria bacterium]